MMEENFNRFLNALEQGDCSGEANNPVQLMLGLTNVCNLHCAFCSYCGFCMQKIEAVEEIPVELLENLKPYIADVKFLNPSGRGEPLLYKDFVTFLRICREAGGLKALHLTNNGTQLHRIDMKELEGINIVAISIDSVDRETFELLRFGAKLDQVLDNVNRLRSTFPEMMIQWSVVVNRLNIDQLFDIFQKAKDMGINYITFNDVYGYEEDKVIQLLRLRKSDYPVIREQFSMIEAANNGAMAVNNVIAYDGFEDGSPRDREAMTAELWSLQKAKPYLDFDEINCEDVATRRIKTENENKRREGRRLPYCTNPFSVMLIQPNLKVSPCCSSYGTIGTIENADVNGVWKGDNYRNLRKAMLDYDMIPDYCRKCTSFVRYDYINEYMEELEKQPDFDLDTVIIPPNFHPLEGTVRSEAWRNRIEEEHVRSEALAQLLCSEMPGWLKEAPEGEKRPVLCLNQTDEKELEIYKAGFPDQEVTAALPCDLPEGRKWPIVVSTGTQCGIRDISRIIEEASAYSSEYTVLLLPYSSRGEECELNRFRTEDIPITGGGVFCHMLQPWTETRRWDQRNISY